MRLLPATRRRMPSGARTAAYVASLSSFTIEAPITVRRSAVEIPSYSIFTACFAEVGNKSY